MQPGNNLGHFEIRKKLGSGGMGEVYLAQDTRLGRLVAIKILPADVADDTDRRARFAQEARAASALSHPNIAHIYDIGEDDGTHFIAMEYIEGTDLSQRLSGASLNQTEVLEIASQIAGALEEARGKSIVHRDIKPANIALTTRGEVKVLDFGLAKTMAHPELDALDQTMTMSQTAEGTVLGTVHYMSPEQALGKKVDTRSDLFSLGVVLYEMVTGRRPFQASSAMGVIEAIAHQTPEALARYNYEMSPELERIILKCLEKDPDNRYQTPRDLLVDLRNLQRAEASGSTVVLESARTGQGRRPGRLTPAVLALVVALVVAAYFLIPRTGAEVGALAVLPFENATGDAELDYLCNGVTESLINTMSQYPDLKVISRRSVFALIDQNPDAEHAGRELGVDAVLFGRVVEHNGELTISTELVDTRDGRQLWGERYIRQLGEIQAVENEITTMIAKTLQVELDGGGVNPLARHATDDPEAYRLYLKGREFTTGTKREMDKAIEYFEQAIALEPNYALAYTGLAQAYVTQSYLRGSERTEPVAKARAAAQQAMKIDPNLAEAHTVSGMIKMVFELDWAGAEADLKKGLELGPGSLVCVMSYGDYFLYTGQYDQALVQYSRAMELDPLSVGAAHDLAITYMVLHDYEQCVIYFQQAIALNPNWTWGHIKLAKTYAHMGRCGEALASTEIAESLLAGSGTPAARCWLAYTYAKCGEQDRARSDLDDLRARSVSEYVDPALYSVIYLGLGELDSAIVGFEQSLAERSSNLVLLRASPALYMDELGAEPRYRAMLKTVGPE
ncbi:MAG: protein kinase [Candidatus Krumholzibacteria bacterium]|nr:protein kinase [Candidatus Krumholzibacteria bacterium]